MGELCSVWLETHSRADLCLEIDDVSGGRAETGSRGPGLAACQGTE